MYYDRTNYANEVTIMHNVEKSAFRRGEYVGYADGCVFRIQKANSSFGNWCAIASHGSNADKYANRHLFAFRLRDLSAKLEALNGGAA